MPDHLTKNTHKKGPSMLEAGMKSLSKRKAKKILKDGSVRGKKLTKKQKGFFGARAGRDLNDSMKRVRSIFS